MSFIDSSSADGYFGSSVSARERILLLIPVQGEPIILCDSSKQTEELVMNYLQYASLPKGYEVTQKQVLALKQTFADLVLIHQSNTLSEFELLVMDKGANALAQQTLRELYTEELKKTKENEWLQNGFMKSIQKEIIEHLEETEGLKKPTGCVVMLLKTTK